MSNIIIEVEETRNLPQSAATSKAVRLSATLFKDAEQKQQSWTSVMGAPVATPGPNVAWKRSAKTAVPCADVSQLTGFLQLHVQREVKAGGMMSAAQFASVAACTLDLGRTAQGAVAQAGQDVEKLKNQQQVVVLDHWLVLYPVEQPAPAAPAGAPQAQIKVKLTLEKMAAGSAAITNIPGYIMTRDVPACYPVPTTTVKDVDRQVLINTPVGKLGMKMFPTKSIEKYEGTIFDPVNFSRGENVKDRFYGTSMARVLEWINQNDDIIELVQLCTHQHSAPVQGVAVFGAVMATIELNYDVTVIYRRKAVDVPLPEQMQQMTIEAGKADVPKVQPTQEQE